MIHQSTIKGVLLIKRLMSKQALDSFSQLADKAPKSYVNNLNDLSSILIEQCRSWTKPDNNHTPARMSQILFDKMFSHVSQPERTILKVSLVARLAKITPNIVHNKNFPDSILSNYPAAFDQLCIVLNKVAENPHNTSYNLFHRLGFVLAINIPCGAQLVDLRSTIPLTSAILSLHRERSLKSLINYVRYQGFGTWFRGHTNVESLEEFNEEGWDKFYLLIAELLLRRKNVRGLVGTSWFYDPQLVNVSPKLSYLQLRQLERGAFLMRHRGTESDIKFATKTSPTRRRLYEEEGYMPVSYSLVWGRNKLLNWAKKNGLKTA